MFIQQLLKIFRRQLCVEQRLGASFTLLSLLSLLFLSFLLLQTILFFNVTENSIASNETYNDREKDKDKDKRWGKSFLLKKT